MAKDGKTEISKEEFKPGNIVLVEFEEKDGIKTAVTVMKHDNL